MTRAMRRRRQITASRIPIPEEPDQANARDAVDDVTLDPVAVDPVAVDPDAVDEVTLDPAADDITFYIRQCPHHIGYVNDRRRFFLT